MTFFKLCLSCAPALAHFQEILPSADVLPEGGEVRLDLVFTHPMERGPTMEKARPKRVGALIDGKTIDLYAALTPQKVDGNSAWTWRPDWRNPGRSCSASSRSPIGSRRKGNGSPISPKWWWMAKPPAKAGTDLRLARPD